MTDMDREVVRAAARDVRSLMRQRQIEAQARVIDRDAWGWKPPDRELEALAVECDAVAYGQRAEAPDLADRLAAVLGDGWEP